MLSLIGQITAVSTLPFSVNDFVETNAYGHSGLGAIISQEQEHECLHPVSYASGMHSLAKQNYRITDLKTLAAAWTIIHLRYYLYDQQVKILTGYTAVKSVLLFGDIRVHAIPPQLY